MNFALKEAASLLLGAALLTACAGLNPPQQEAADPAYKARLDQLANHRCNNRIATAVQGTGVPANQITQLFYTEDLDSMDERVVRYSAWMRLAGQPGQLVVDADAIDCRPTQVYTRYGAKVEGIPSY
jgi:hypothetical protein